MTANVHNRLESNLVILIVDDEASIRKTLGICLETEGHKVIGVGNHGDAFAELRQKKFDLAFLDIRLGTDNGIQILPELLKISPWLKVVMITAHASIDSAVEAMRSGAFDYITKPFSVAHILAAVGKVAHVKRLEDEVVFLKEKVQEAGDIELRTHSPLMQKAIELAREVAPTDASVLITGENGTGKSVLAKAIHSWSRRTKSPFSVISCPSLSPELLESELFGHVKGAFTGAVRSSPGRIAGCEGGTLFLDEIGDLPLALQPKLLRFVQDKEYESVGDNVTNRADVRVVAATNVDLNQAVKQGSFREDLFYRINVIQVHMPSLRERREDIPLLASKFLSAFTKEKKIFGFTDDAIGQLRSHGWPGNIRELRNVIERAAILCHGNYIEPKHFTLISESLADGGGDDRFVTLESMEQSHIRRVLAATRTMEETARILGIDAATLWRKRKKYGL